MAEVERLPTSNTSMVNPAENAIDTKTNNSIVEPAILTVIDTVAFGFGDVLIGQGAAYNTKTESARATSSCDT